MRICAAQTRPLKGDIEGNIGNHIEWIYQAVSIGADAIIFPELSLTGYEPTLAKELATTQIDSRFDDFQNISNSRRVTIGVGVPTKNSKGICISMIYFQPNRSRQIYSKQYLHMDEKPFFISAQNSLDFLGSESTMAPAICYEISVPEHAEHAFGHGANIYLASVAKFVTGIDKAVNRLSAIANKYSMTVLMSNCIGECDGRQCAGKTSVWNDKGILAGQLNDTNEGIILIDTDTLEIISRQGD